LFARWKPRLQPGDIVYLPLEEAQYLRPRDASDLGPNAAIMLRHDRTTLQTLPLRRQIAALFAGDLRAAVMSLIEPRWRMTISMILAWPPRADTMNGATMSATPPLWPRSMRLRWRR
jgi:hypothetical protein